MSHPLPGLPNAPDQTFSNETLGDLSDAMDATRKAREAQLTSARRAVAYSLQAPAMLKAMWKQLIADCSPDRIEELHVHREKVLAAFENWAETIRLTMRIMPKAEELAGSPLEGSERLSDVLEQTERFTDAIFSRWTNPEGLAEAIVETFELPEWLTTGPIPAHLQPPQSWYEETKNPFE